MNSAKFVFGAALTGIALVALIPHARSATARPDMTLLTGPHLLSTPARPLESASIASELVTPVKMTSAPDPNAARLKLVDAKARLERLKAERAAALEAKKKLDASMPEGAFNPAPNQSPAADHIRFDTSLPPTPKELLQAAPLFKRD